jgi:hypothetical protein
MGLKVLKSISLTNFPAVKDLKPVELAEAIAAEVRANVDATAGKEDGRPNEIVVMLGGFEMAKQNQDVKTENQEAPEEEAPVVIETPAEQEQPAELSEQAAPVENKEAPAMQTAALAELLAQARKEMAAEFTELLAKEVQKAHETAKGIVEASLAEMKAEQDLVLFSERITSTGKNALPVEPTVVAELLRGLPPIKQHAVRSLLETISVHGTVDFSEVGTSQGDDKPVKRKLSAQEREMVLGLMADGTDIKQVFADAGELLGDIEQYDLSEFGN